MNFLSQVASIARLEAGVFLRFPKLLVATLVVAMIPALYTLIYLSSVWDPSAHTPALAVGLVNLDKDIEYRGQTLNVGKEVVAQLKVTHRFGFQDGKDEASVRQAVREGHLAFALVIPADFSSHAVPGALVGAGKLVVYASEGNNYQSASIARRFADDLGHAVNESLNERRWDLVISTAAGSKRSVDRLRQGMGELQTGAYALETGSAQLAQGARDARTAAKQIDAAVDELTNGVSQVGSSLRLMDAARPKQADLTRLQSGAETLSHGHAELGDAMAELQSGTKKLVKGVGAFITEAEDSVLVPARVLQGLDELQAGTTTIDAAVAATGAAQNKLLDGSRAMSTGVSVLATGAANMGSAIHAITNKLPEEARLKELGDGTNHLVSGTAKLADAADHFRVGTQHLAAGVDVLVAALPVSMQNMEGSARGMAQSVLPVFEVDASVPNQGSSFAPNVVSAALWLGAGIIAFLINVRVLPQQAQNFSRPAKFIGKMVVPATIVLAQTLFILLTLTLVLHIQILHQGPIVITLVIAALSFLCLVLVMTQALGDAGRALAMLFLAVQLSSSGGVLPVELSGGLFANISPWLPMTWVVKASKAAMFGAYDNAWQWPVVWLALVGMVATGFACLWGRWRFLNLEHIGPEVDF